MTIGLSLVDISESCEPEFTRRWSRAGADI